MHFARRSEVLPAGCRLISAHGSRGFSPNLAFHPHLPPPEYHSRAKPATKPKTSYKICQFLTNAGIQASIAKPNQNPQCQLIRQLCIRPGAETWNHVYVIPIYMCNVFVCLCLCLRILSLFVYRRHDCRLDHSVKRILTGDRKSLLLTSPIAHYRQRQQ